MIRDAGSPVSSYTSIAVAADGTKIYYDHWENGYAADLANRPPEWFHTYAFNTLRQVGANFELLGSHLGWLAEQGERGLDGAKAAAEGIAETAKVMQFKLARAMARKKFDGLTEMIEAMALAHDEAIGTLARLYGHGARAGVAA